ncbi:MAG: AraC family transcriptional regulator ligand-binding domain-containing protein [Planctomycetota bacterium]
MPGTHRAKSTVRAGTVAISAAFAIRRGVGLDELQEMCGVDGLEIMRPDARIDAEVLARLWRGLEARFPGQLLSLELCRVAPPSLAGEIWHGAQFARDIGEVVEFFRQNSILLGDLLEIRISQRADPDEVGISISHPIDAVTQGSMTELRLGFAWRLLSELAAEPIDLSRVEFAHGPNGAPEDYRRHFDCEVRFECPESALIVGRQTLEMPTSQATAALFEFARSYLERCRGRLSDELVQGELQRLVQVIRRSAASGCFDSRSVAAAAGMSLRTAQRLSSEGGESLAERISAARADLAREALLDPRISVASVAHLAGYADTRSFRRAFRRWTGLTPTDFREGADNGKRAR